MAESLIERLREWREEAAKSVAAHPWKPFYVVPLSVDDFDAVLALVEAANDVWLDLPFESPKRERLIAALSALSALESRTP